MKDQKSILIVDDDVEICETFRLIFIKEGYQIDIANNGKEALEKVKKQFYNLVILDIRLPGITGVDLLKPFKKLHPEMAIIMGTAFATLENAIQALNEGASYYITKPLKPNEVIAAVKAALEKQNLVLENRRLFKEAQQEIKERKKTEKELQMHRDQLEELVTIRTREIEEKNKKLQEFNQLFVGREFRIKELKEKVKRLELDLIRAKE